MERRGNHRRESNAGPHSSLLSIPPKYSVSSFMGYLKGKSAMMIFERHANLKYKFGNRHFWATGYYVSTVGIQEKPYGSISRSKRNRIRLRIKSAPRSTKTLLRVKRGNQSTMGLNIVKASVFQALAALCPFRAWFKPRVSRVVLTMAKKNAPQQ